MAVAGISAFWQYCHLCSRVWCN